MSHLYLISPPDVSPLLSKMIEAVVGHHPFTIVNTSKNLPDLTGKRIVFALELDCAGLCIPVHEIMSELCRLRRDALAGASGVVLVHSSSELYTKSAAQSIIFMANQMGCSFSGHPLVEATGSLNNFLTWQKTLALSLEEICQEQCQQLGLRFMESQRDQIEKPRILALHASSHRTSNTLALWEMTRSHLDDCDVEVFHIENGEVKDCKGCSFKTCIHYSNCNSCFYGGIMVEDIYPAIERSDAVVWICPNYNDAVSANLMAVINRLTALYRKTSFNKKCIYAVIVSGNSGSDSIAKQLIGALNINKGFHLPPHFAIMETANDPGTIMQIEDIEQKAAQFAKLIKAQYQI